MQPIESISIMAGSIVLLKILDFIFYALDIRVRLLFEWRDLWMGVFIDTKKRKLYILPVPMFGITFEFEPED